MIFTWVKIRNQNTTWPCLLGGGGRGVCVACGGGAEGCAGVLDVWATASPLHYCIKSQVHLSSNWLPSWFSQGDCFRDCLFTLKGEVTLYRHHNYPSPWLWQEDFNALNKYLPKCCSLLQRLGSQTLSACFFLKFWDSISWNHWANE